MWQITKNIYRNKKSAKLCVFICETLREILFLSISFERPSLEDGRPNKALTYRAPHTALSKIHILV